LAFDLFEKSAAPGVPENLANQTLEVLAVEALAPAVILEDLAFEVLVDTAETPKVGNLPGQLDSEAFVALVVLLAVLRAVIETPEPEDCFLYREASVEFL
jgi:hypothetical protein